MPARTRFAGTSTSTTTSERRERRSTGTYDVLATLRRSGEPFQLTPGALGGSLMLSTGGMTGRARPTRASRSGDALPRPWRPPLPARHANGPWPPAHRSSTRRRRGDARTTARRSSTWPPPAAQRTAPRSPHRRHPRSLSTTGVAGTPIRAERNARAEVLTCCSTRRASGGAVWVVRRRRSE